MLFAFTVFISCFALLIVMFGLVPFDNDAGPWKLYGELLSGAFIMALLVLVLKYLCIGLILILGV
jgi:hypothetical protein